MEACPRLADEIRDALDRKDARAVGRGARSLKGSLAPGAPICNRGVEHLGVMNGMGEDGANAWRIPRGYKPNVNDVVKHALAEPTAAAI